MVAAVPRPLLQPSIRKTGTINSSESKTPPQPEAIVCTQKVMSPPITVPRILLAPAFQVWSSLSSTANRVPVSE